MAIDRDVEQILRPLGLRAKCANPSCDELARVPGEFCRACVAQQRRAREEYRRSRELAR
jgi:hypothetical protein